MKSTFSILAYLPLDPNPFYLTSHDKIEVITQAKTDLDVVMPDIFTTIIYTNREGLSFNLDGSSSDLVMDEPINFLQ